MSKRKKQSGGEKMEERVDKSSKARNQTKKEKEDQGIRKDTSKVSE